jgi:hypothetical protein
MMTKAAAKIVVLMTVPRVIGIYMWLLLGF